MTKLSHPILGILALLLFLPLSAMAAADKPKEKPGAEQSAAGADPKVSAAAETTAKSSTAAASSVVYIASGQLDPLLAAPVALGVIVGAKIGSRLSMRVSQDVLRLAFIGVAVIFSIGMFGQFLSL